MVMGDQQQLHEDIHHGMLQTRNQFSQLGVQNFPQSDYHTSSHGASEHHSTAIHDGQHTFAFVSFVSHPVSSICISSSLVCHGVMLSSSRLRGGGDNDKDKKVPQWDCKKGPSFERTRREVRVFASGYYCSPNDDYNVWDAYTGVCMGGDAVGAPALPVGAGAAAQTRIRNRSMGLSL